MVTDFPIPEYFSPRPLDQQPREQPPHWYSVNAAVRSPNLRRLDVHALFAVAQLLVIDDTSRDTDRGVRSALSNVLDLLAGNSSHIRVRNGGGSLLGILYKNVHPACIAVPASKLRPIHACNHLTSTSVLASTFTLIEKRWH